MPEITRKRGSRVLGGVLLLVWMALSWRELASSARNGTALHALIAAAVALAICLLLPGLPRRLVRLVTEARPVHFVGFCAFAAFVLSLWMVHGPMRNRVLSIDGSVYLLEARALSHGHFGMPIPTPRLPFGGRFLFEGPDGRLYGVFPPGFPLFVAPFVWLGRPYLAGPVIAALLVVAQWMLGRTLLDPREREEGSRSEWAPRFAIVLSLPSFARVIETSDLLSHAFLALLSTVAIALALRALERPTIGRALGIGACVGWAFSARLLDGAILVVAIAGIVLFGVIRRRLGVRFLAFATLAALPFVVLLAAQQHAATGSWRTPTQTEYFVRSDHPTTCHRLGFGTDVGCAVEHPDSRASFGADGYGLDDAAKVTRERAERLGDDLFGFGPILLLGFAAAMLRGHRRDALLAFLVVAFTIGYGLFYYGNAPLFGARHLFPIAPLLWLLVARAIEATPHRVHGLFDTPHARATVALCVLAAVGRTAVPRFQVGIAVLSSGQGNRVDIRSVMTAHHVDHGVVVTGDELSYIGAVDPWRDGDGLVLVKFDGSGLLELRRSDPTKPMHFVLQGDQYQTTLMRPPARGITIELESAWPSFQRPSGIATRIVYADDLARSFGMSPSPSFSGGRVLFVLHATTGGTMTIPIWVGQAGRYSLRVDGLVAPDFGRYEFTLDGAPIPIWEGYSREPAFRRGQPSPARWIAAGAHTLALRCLGRSPESRGELAAFDALVGTPE